MKIRKAKDEDITLIEKLLMKNNLPYEDIYLKIDNFFVGYTEEGIIGIGGLELFGRFGLLRSLVVKKDFRGKGFGRILCQRLEEYAKVKGVEELYLLTTTAETFFEKLGFKKIDRNSVPEAVKNSDEFRVLCPASAICMMKKIAEESKDF